MNVKGGRELRLRFGIFTKREIGFAERAADRGLQFGFFGEGVAHLFRRIVKHRRHGDIVALAQRRIDGLEHVLEEFSDGLGATFGGDGPAALILRDAALAIGGLGFDPRLLALHVGGAAEITFVQNRPCRGSEQNCQNDA